MKPPTGNREGQSQLRQRLRSPEETFLTRAELAARLRMPLRTLDYWSKRRWLPRYKVGRAVRFKWSEVEAALRTHCSKPN